MKVKTKQNKTKKKKEKNEREKGKEEKKNSEKQKVTNKASQLLAKKTLIIFAFLLSVLDFRHFPRRPQVLAIPKMD